jgi:dephospho-CoA kinase
MIIGLSGYAQTGKDTVAKFLVEHYGFTRIAFADPIREALYALDPMIADYPAIPNIRLSWIVDRSGWESVKQESAEVRRLLQRLGTEVARNQWSPSFWVDLAMQKANKFDKVVITDVRYPNEYEAIRGANGDVWRVTKPGVVAVNSHPSETELDKFVFDGTISNDGSFESLHKSVEALIRNIPL